MVLKNYTVTEFRMEFETSQKLAVIICHLVDSSNSTWSLEIKQYTDDEERKLSLYEKAEVIKEVFNQEYHEIKAVFCDFDGQKFKVLPKSTVSDIVVQIAKQI